MIRIEGNLLKIDFRDWNLESYRVFLQSKKLPEHNLVYDEQTDSYQLAAPARFAHIFGIDPGAVSRDWLPFSAHLFDYQAEIVRVALWAKRFACWADTGLGKSHIELEFTRQVAHKTNGKVLCIMPLNIIAQTLAIQKRYFPDFPEITVLQTKEHLRAWCADGRPGPGIGIVNPEKFIPKKSEAEVISEIRHCSGVVLDEASILKTSGGKIKWSLIKSCKGVEYKLSLTATPAPNDTMEYASQGSFLEKLRNEGEILWTFFTRDKEGNWKVKPHAEAAFYRFMAGWSMYLRNPANYGFADNLKDLPLPVIREYRLDPTEQQKAFIDPGKSKLSMVERSKYSQIAKGFIYRDGKSPERAPSIKPDFVCNLIWQDALDGLQPIVWTVFDEETEILAEMLQSTPFSYEILTGKVSKEKRLAIIDRYLCGETDVLLTRAQLLGYGMNFQNCGSMIFSGFDDSFERMYQAIRRAYRYGQTKAVRVHVPFIPELEGVVWANLQEKQIKFENDTRIMEANYMQAMRGFCKHAA